MAKIAANGQFIEELEDNTDDLEVVIEGLETEIGNMEYQGYFTDASVSYPFTSSVVEGHLILDNDHNIVDAVIGDISLQTFLENGVDIKPVFMDDEDFGYAVTNFSVVIGSYFPYVVDQSLIAEIKEMCEGKDQIVLDAGCGTGWPCWHAEDAKELEYEGGTRWRLKSISGDPWALYAVEYETSYLSGSWEIALATDDLKRLILKLRSSELKGSNDIV